jgi:hypothetical protein
MTSKYLSSFVFLLSTLTVMGNEEAISTLEEVVEEK